MMSVNQYCTHCECAVCSVHAFPLTVAEKILSRKYLFLIMKIDLHTTETAHTCLSFAHCVLPLKTDALYLFCCVWFGLVCNAIENASFNHAIIRVCVSRLMIIFLCVMALCAILFTYYCLFSLYDNGKEMAAQNDKTPQWVLC